MKKRRFCGDLTTRSAPELRSSCAQPVPKNFVASWLGAAPTFRRGIMTQEQEPNKILICKVDGCSGVAFPSTGFCPSHNDTHGTEVNAMLRTGDAVESTAVHETPDFD